MSPQTGSAERQAADPQSPWWGEHVARYLFAARHARDAAALDVACGTGFGLPIIAAHARFAVGADCDAATLAVARGQALGTSVVLASDATRLPFRSETFGLVTSFETIEHLADPAAFVVELERVLCDDGICFLSTPNARYTRPVDGTPRNPFHLREYDPEELRIELQRRFSSVTLVGQSLDRERFVRSPFWDDQERVPRSLAGLAHRALRRLLLPAPAQVRDAVSRIIWGHQYYPRPEDYVFNDGVGLAPVTLAICRKRSVRD